MGAITGLRGEPVDLLASIGSENLGVLADLSALAGNVVLSSVLELGCVGCWCNRLALTLTYETRTGSTFESLLRGLGVTTSLVEVVAGTDRGDTTTDLESSGHVGVLVGRTCLFG